MSRRLTAVLATTVVLVLTVLTGGRPAAAGPVEGNCGRAVVHTGTFGGGKLDIVLQVDLKEPFTHVITGFATGWFMNRSAGRFGGLSAQSPNYRSTIDEDIWDATWDDEDVGAGYVHIGFPIVDVLTTQGHCFGLFPTETVLVPEGEQALLRREIPLTSKDKADYTFAVDNTGSNEIAVEALDAQAQQIADSLVASSADTRVRVVEFGDASARVVQDWTGNPAAIRQAFRSITPTGGGDRPEAVHSALELARRGAWRPDATRHVVLIGDAPGKDPEPGTGLTFTQVVRNLSTVTFSDGADGLIDVSYKGYLPVDVVDVRGRNAAYFQALAGATGGTYRTSPPRRIATGLQTLVAAIGDETPAA